MICIYLAERPDPKNPWGDHIGLYPYVLPYVISLGMLIRDGVRLKPRREWSMETIGL